MAAHFTFVFIQNRLIDALIRRYEIIIVLKFPKKDKAANWCPILTSKFIMYIYTHR